MDGHHFLGTFAMSEGQKGCEFFIPTSIVRFLVEVMEVGPEYLESARRILRNEGAATSFPRAEGATTLQPRATPRATPWVVGLPA